MRLLKWTCGLLTGLLVVYAVLAWLVPIHPAADRAFFEGVAGTLVIAHQGGRGLRPENTMLAFDHAAALGADVLEMDLQATRDGHMVVMHDATVDRTTDGTGRVADLTLAEIRKLDAGYRFRDRTGDYPYRGRGLEVPTVEEVLARFPGRRLNMEMKDFGEDLARQFCRVLRDHDAANDVLVASFGHRPMLAFREACPEIATSATLREGLMFYQLTRVGLGSLFRSEAAAFEVPEFFGDIHVVHPAFLDLARSFHMRVEVWTVNDEADLERMLSFRVDGIITDYPDRLLKLLGRPGTMAEDGPGAPGR